MKKNKFFSIVLCLALLVSMLPAAAFAAPANDYPFTIIFGTKAYDQMALAKPELAAEIKAAFIANSNKFFWVKADKTIIDNFGAAVDLATLPKNITLKKGDGTQTMINEGEESLQVISISAINATTIEVAFSGKVDPGKINVDNFTVVDKNSLTTKPTGIARKEKEGKTVVTLTVPTLSLKKAPYKMLFNKAALGLSSELMSFELPAAAPVFEKIVPVNAKAMTFVANAELNVTLPGAVDISFKDLTEPTNKPGAIGPVAVGDAPYAKTGMKVSVANDFFIAGHEYQIRIAEEKLVDVFGNKNAEDYIYKFTVEKNENKPVLTKVALHKHKDNNKVSAVLDFDMSVLPAGANIKIDLIEVGGPTENVTVNNFKKFGDEAEVYVTGLGVVAANQIVLEDVTNANTIPLDPAKTYQLAVREGQVKSVSIPEMKNDFTKASEAVAGIDITVPTLEKGTLVSAKEITLEFSEKVKLADGATVTFHGFKADGTPGDIAAKVKETELSKTITLMPIKEKELFDTEDVAAAVLKYAKGAFVDEFGNEIAVMNAQIPGAVDKAAPVAVKAAFAGGKITITFTEDVVLVAAPADAPTLYVEGNPFAYNAGGGAGTWKIDSGKVVVEGAALAADQLVILEAEALKDAQENKSGKLEITSK